MFARAEEAVSIAVDDGDVFSLRAFVRWVVVVRLDRLTRGDYDRAFADLRQRGSGIRVHLCLFPKVRPRLIGKASPRTMMWRLQWSQPCFFQSRSQMATSASPPLGSNPFRHS